MVGKSLSRIPGREITDYFSLKITRGGGGLGRFHHEQGRQLLKWNTFLDYRSCAEYLISNLRTTPALLCGSFGSAGGLIGGVLVNEFPRLFKAVVMRSDILLLS